MLHIISEVPYIKWCMLIKWVLNRALYICIHLYIYIYKNIYILIILPLLLSQSVARRLEIQLQVHLRWVALLLRKVPWRFVSVWCVWCGPHKIKQIHSKGPRRDQSQGQYNCYIGPDLILLLLKSISLYIKY